MPVANAHHFNPIHYNAIAKDIREEFSDALDRIIPGDYRSRQDSFIEVTILSKLAIRFAKRFAIDSDEFDPLLFLERCSPDNDLYPITELWDND